MRRIALLGFVIWLAATVALRLGGQLIFRGSAGGIFGIAVLFVVSLPLMVLVAWAILSDAQDRALGAIALVAPGMVLDSFTTIGFARVFPNMTPEAAPVFGGWLLFCNVVVLLTAALWRQTGSRGSALDVGNR